MELLREVIRMVGLILGNFPISRGKEREFSIMIMEIFTLEIGPMTK